jgi:hypothetical protein
VFVLVGPPSMSPFPRVTLIPNSTTPATIDADGSRSPLIKHPHHSPTAPSFTLARGMQDVRKKAVDTVTDLANQEMARDRPWHALQAQAFSMTQVPSDRGVTPTAVRESSAFRMFSGCPNVVLDLQTDAVLGVFQRGLPDTESTQVRSLYVFFAYLIQTRIFF